MLIFSVLLSSLVSAESMDTLPYRYLDANGQRCVRPIPECQWSPDDLSASTKPEAETIGSGVVLRVRPAIEIRMSEGAGEPAWTPAERLVAYTPKALLERYTELGLRHGRRNFHYETPHNLRTLVASGTGFELAPGDLVVVIGDVSLLRQLHGLPVVEFRVLEPTSVGGEIVYRPTVRRGALPLEVVERSTEIVYGECSAALE